jgi:hypothetical protein
MLPTLGMVRLPGAEGWCRLRSVPRAGGVEVSFGTSTVEVRFRSAGSARAATWLPLRRLQSSTGGLTITVALDDVDPFRDFGHLQTMGRLAPTAVDAWQANLEVAWPLLVEDDRSLAEAISDGVTTLVPLEPTPAATELSASSHDAIGAIALTPPRTPLSLALALVHEFQHNKLSALIDLVPLVDRAAGKLHYAPWRPDPRPLHGLLHGTYAFLGLAAFWDRQRSHPPMAREGAGFEFALLRGQVGVVLRALANEPRLLPPGARFVEGMRRRLTDLDRSVVGGRDRALARLARLDHAIAWRLRNVEPDQDAVGQMASAWLAGRSCSWPDQQRPTLRDGRGPMPSDHRLALFRRAATRAGPREWHADIPTASTADHLLVAGDHARAAEAYGKLLDADPDDLAAWSGMAVACRLTTGASPILVARPEIVRAVHRAIAVRTGRGPNVGNLAAWIAGGVRNGRRRPRPLPSQGDGLEVERDALALPGVEDVEVVGGKDRFVAGDRVAGECVGSIDLTQGPKVNRKVRRCRQGMRVVLPYLCPKPLQRCLTYVSGFLGLADR